MKKIRLLGLALLLVIIIWGGLFSNTASSQQIDSRLNNLEAHFNRLELQLNQIQSQLNQNRSPSSRTTVTLPQPSRSRRNLSSQQREQMFDRLATLLVELKQQVNQIDKRVSKLESR
ncbi:MAG: hypothetical protein KME60_24340 [Cyanomargarita calcarea GSE-NOS-MK-12-04C]|jgi:small-conductance mechanosensitive channel|uniref:Uncharacterized protein n=1 Tax=Cyanomargarita calcarea GSE-NOS-MK-12-04C TaxID=2839659 RepID=A0A951QQ54_9CYAN|nr:hypothetical protein [Cyanomargarita calcarea GSE-NOS-MK-12-04C]